MKKLGLSKGILNTVILTAFTLSSQSALSALIPGSIVKVSDGDTVNVKPNPAKAEILKVRMVGIDTPELHFPTPSGGWVGQGIWGEKAREELVKLSPTGTSVALQSQGLDKYGRTLGRVFKGGADVNLAMVKSGWAYPYIICDGTYCTKNFFKKEKVADYLKACKDARAKGLGVFDPANPLTEYPYEFRSRLRGENPSKYVGDYTTKQLYEPSEHRKVDICNAIFFITKSAAHKAGFK